MAQKSTGSRQKKFQRRKKKIPLGFRGFRTYFWEVDYPLCHVWNKKTQILIEFLDGTKKVQLAGKKSFLVAKKSSPRV